VPIFSFFYLKSHLDQSGTEEFLKKYETLYQSLKPYKDSVFIHSSLFCLRRLSIAVGTVMMNEFTVGNILIYYIGSLCWFIYIFKYQPMESREMNNIEIFNEIVT
jgi:hypothetical protein